MSRIWPRLASTLSVTSGNVSPRPFKEMPTEKGNSLLFGIGPQLMKEKNYQFPFYRRLVEKHGKVFRMKVAPGKYLVVLSDPEDVDFVQQNEGKYPNRGSALRVMKLLFSGDLSSPSSMLATSDGPEWKKLRSELNPVVNPRKLGRHVERLDPVSQTFLEIVQESVDKDGYSRDLMEFLPFWSMEAIARFLYPKPLSVQRERDQRVVDTYDGMQLMFKALRLRYIPLWVLKYLPLKAMKEGKEGVRKYQTATHSILADMERNDNSTAKNPTEGTFYEQWKAQGWTHETILLVMADFLAAGTDTTINTTAYSLHQLAKHPEVQKKAHDEVVSVAGKDGVITDEVMQKLSYIKAIQKEAGRFGSLGGVTGARMLNEDVEIGGYRIPAKTMIVSCTAAMKSNPDIFVNPDEFRPERWLREEENDKLRKVQQIAAANFGRGVRNCLGRRVAELEMWTLLAKIMQQAKLELHPESVDLQPVGGGLMKPDRPLKVKITSV